MTGRKQFSKARKAHSTFSLLVMCFFHAHTYKCALFFQHESLYKESHLLAYLLKLPLWSVGPICCVDALAGAWMCRCVHRQSLEHKHKDSNIRTFQPEPDTATLKPEMWTSKFSTPQKERTILHPSKRCLSSLCFSYSLLSLSHIHTFSNTIPPSPLQTMGKN